MHQSLVLNGKAALCLFQLFLRWSRECEAILTAENDTPRPSYALDHIVVTGKSPLVLRKYIRCSDTPDLLHPIWRQASR